jgi:hypothetical protein
MKGAHKWPLFVAALFLGLTSTRVSAISPSAVLVYGENVAQPVLLRPTDPADFPAFGLLSWRAGSYRNPTRIDQQLWSGLKNRPYVNLAIFWGRYDADQLKPENASQHGRFYPATATEPAIVVTTVPDMQKRSNPIPRELERFAAAWTLSSQELSTLKNLGFPTRRSVGDDARLYQISENGILLSQAAPNTGLSPVWKFFAVAANAERSAINEFLQKNFVCQ